MTGRVIAGRYNLQHPIGRGAMGVVWRARDQLLDRDVAVKEVVISALISADERHTAYQRTLREARTAARLSHRGVVTVYDVAEEDGRPWIVMELIPSQSLDQVLTVQGRLSVARVCAIGQQLLSALAAAHTAGVLHRDVKPSNVLIANSKVGDSWEERAVLTDFGIAQFEGDPRLTQTGMVMGSPGFTAPERIRGGDATPASDLWSLGATIYAAVEGRGPFEQRGGAITTMSAIINEDAPVAPHAAQLAPLIAALLRRDPSARPSAASAARSFADVLPYLTDVPEQPPAASHPPTVLSAHVPSPAAASAVSAPASAAEGVPADAAPAKADAADKQAADKQAADKQAAAAAEPAKEAAQDSPADEAAADQAGPDSASAAEPAAAAEPEAKAKAEPAPESGPDTGSEPVAGVAPSTVATPVIAAAQAAEVVPAAVPAVDSETGGAPTVFADPPEAKAARADGVTVVTDEGSGYQPTELAIPAARVTPAAPAPEQPPAPQRPADQRPAQQRPAPPKPTFTAAKPTERPTPSYSAASPARPKPPTPAPERRPAYGGSSAAGQGQPGGGTTPFPPASGQYAGPSQSYPDLARQYAPGAGGGSAGRGRGRGRQIAWLVVAVIIAAAVGVGAALALNHHNGGGSPGAAQSTGSGFVADTPTGFKSVDALNKPSAVLPSGWWHATVTAADLGAPAVAGFSLDLPPGWTEQRSSLATNFTGPGDLLVTVDLTPQSTTDMLAAATSIERESVAENKFPGYKRVNLQEVPVRNTKGAVWKFTWTPATGPGLVADDILFAKATPAGSQDYAIYIRSPQSTFGGTALPLFDQILQTFQTVPAS